MTASPPLPRLPARAADSHKGDYGRALIVGGSRGMSGAVALAGMAALRAGAGLVTLGLPEECLATIAALEPSYMTLPLRQDRAGRISQESHEILRERAGYYTCLGVGPGLGRSNQLTELVEWMYDTLPQPLVVDADGLNALAAAQVVKADPAGPRIVTPHPGEFRRLVGRDDAAAGDMQALAVQWAADHRAVLVLKGASTLVTDGTQLVRNQTGNPGMATGGSGDVLTGVIVALVCQGLSPWEAAHLGVHVHGLAGDLAAERLGQVSMIASDLVRYLPQAFQQLEGPHRP